MRNTVLPAARRRVSGLAVLAMLAVAGTARAAEYAASTTKFETGRGYAAVTGNVGTTLSVATHHYSYLVNAGTVNVFYHVQPSGGSTAHTFNVTVSNFGPRAMDQYNFQVGTSITASGDYYRRADVDQDGNPDYLDPDDDADTVPDTVDNAPWRANANQV